MTRPTWAEMRETSPALCEAVVGWIYAADLGAAWALLTKGHANTPGWLTDDLEVIRLRAAEYRMEAASYCVKLAETMNAADLAGDLEDEAATYLLARLQASGGFRDALADALDAAADEAERLAGGGA